MLLRQTHRSFFFFFNDTATTEIYTLSLHDALPIFGDFFVNNLSLGRDWDALNGGLGDNRGLGESFRNKLSFSLGGNRSEEHTSELQSRLHLVCRLLLEKKKNI